MAAIGLELVAPRELAAAETTPRGVLPFGLGGQSRVAPRAIRVGVAPRDVDDRMIIAALERRTRSLGMAPVGAEHLTPPRCAHDAAGVGEVVGKERAEDERPAEAFCIRAVVGGRHEFGELGIGDGVRSDRIRREPDRGGRVLRHRLDIRPGPSEPITNGSTGMSISVREATAVGRSSSSWIAMSVRSAVSIVLRSGVQHSVIIEPLVGDPSAAASADPDVIEST
jgi:hypothetical protein